MSEALPPCTDASGLSSVSIEPISGWALASVIARKGCAGDLAAKAEALFGAAPPIGPKYVQAANIGFVGLAPGKWLAVATGRDGWDLEASLREALSGLASVSDQSDAYVLVRLSGPRARDVLAKGVAIDFHPSAFKAGDAAVTSMFLVGITLWQFDDAPSYVLALARSFASCFMQHLAKCEVP